MLVLWLFIKPHGNLLLVLSTTGASILALPLPHFRAQAGPLAPTTAAPPAQMAGATAEATLTGLAPGLYRVRMQAGGQQARVTPTTPVRCSRPLS